ncbi:MAG: nucleotide exchange factor GrpE [Ruminococcaceae bacterium]|nr:nucleotide exchange factor GrpE [Oscillospiraceae bacterium]
MKNKIKNTYMEKPKVNNTDVKNEQDAVPETEEVKETAAAEEETKAEDKCKKDKKSDAKKLKAEIEELKKALEAEKVRAEEATDKYLRVVAEYDNFRKRSQKEKDAVYGDAVADTVKGIIPIIDNLQYAQKYQDGDREKFAEGVELILSKVPETLEKMNIKMFGEAGEQFNPEIHNAVFHMEDETLGENVIAEVLQCGYMHGDKVIRYAMVKVAN